MEIALNLSFALNRILAKDEKINVLNFILKKAEYRQVDKFLLENNKVVFKNNFLSLTPRAWGYIDAGEFWLSDNTSYTVLQYKFYFGKRVLLFTLLWVVVLSGAIAMYNLQFTHALQLLPGIVFFFIIYCFKIYIGQNNIINSIAKEINDYYK